MEKLIIDGKVAVLVSHGHGAGWYSWHGIEEFLFHPKIVELVEHDRREEITEELCKDLLPKYADKYICVLGTRGLDIHWLNEGTNLTIEEYDGAEGIRLISDLTLRA